jgi:hypothetical protein
LIFPLQLFRQQHLHNVYELLNTLTRLVARDAQLRWKSQRLFWEEKRGKISECVAEHVEVEVQTLSVEEH